METTKIITAINEQAALALPADTSFEDMRAQLQVCIGNLIENDFQQLVHMLYRVDVNERKLKYLLQENVGADAPVIIADLIIERQIEKIKSRAAFTRSDDDSSEEEKW
ncbi:MAG: hypothetical protein ABIU63_04410 [Chitinophagaceae bacterium]